MIRNFLKTEWSKLREMNFTDKRQYIWEYYKIHILFIVIGSIAIGSLINIWFINPPRRSHLYIAWQAGLVHTNHLDEMGERLSVIVDNPDRYHVLVNTYILGEDSQINNAMVTRFHALLSVGEVSAIIATYQGIQEGSDFGLLRPPTGVLAIIREDNPPLYEALLDRLLTITFEEEDGTYTTDIMAINISGAPLVTDVGIEMDDLYLGLIANFLYDDRIIDALAVMFDLSEAVRRHN